MNIPSNILSGWLLILVSLLELCLFFYVFRFEKTLAIKSYLVFVLGVILWVLANGVSFLAGEGDITFIQKFAFLGGTILISALLVFVYTFPFPQSRNIKYIQLFAIGSTIFFALWMFCTDSFIPYVTLDQNGFMDSSTEGVGLWVWSVFFLIVWLMIAIRMVRLYLHSSGETRIRVRYLCIGIAITSFIGITTDVIMPLFAIAHYAGIGSLFSIVWLWFSFKAVTFKGS